MSAAEVRVRMGGGTDVSKVLGQINGTMRGVRSSVVDLKKELAAAGQTAVQMAKDTTDAVKEVSTAIKEQTAAQQAANEAAKKAREAAQQRAQEARAAREVARALREQQKAAEQLAHTLVTVGKSAVSAAQNMNKMAGVKSQGELRAGADDVEELLVRARTSLGPDMTRAKWEKMGASDIFKNVALAANKPVDEVIRGFIDIQNETSRGGELLANNGALFKEQARFAQATGGKVGEAGITLAKFAEQYGISPEDQKKLPGMLITQQLQGSLEAATSAKFIKTAASHRLLTGKTGIEGFAELMAMGNVIKDKAGLQGQQGAATAATWLGSLIGDLSKGKSVTGADTSPVAILQKLTGKNYRDAQGHVDPIAMAEGLSGYKEKAGPKKFMETLGMAFRNTNSRRGMMMLMSSIEQDKGTEKSIQALANPSAAKGQALIEDTLGELGTTAAGKGRTQDVVSTMNMLKNKKPSDEFFGKWRENIEGFMTEHPSLAAAADVAKPILGAAAGIFGYKRAGAAINTIRTGAAGLVSSVGLGTLGLAGGAMFLPGDVNPNQKQRPEAQRAAQIAELQKAIAERQASEQKASQGGIGGWIQKTFFGAGTDESKAGIQVLIDELKKLQQPPVINIIVQDKDTEARVIAEVAHPTPALAAGAGAPKPNAHPGRR